MHSVYTNSENAIRLPLRASGTEPLMRIDCESCSKESVAKVLESARKFALGVLIS